MPLSDTNPDRPLWQKVVPNAVQDRVRQSPILQKIIVNIGWLSVERIFTLVVRFFVGVWVVRHLGPEKFGVYSYALSFAMVFSAIATLGLEKVVIRDLSQAEETSAVDEILTSALLLRLGGGGATFALLAAIIFSTEDSALLQWAVLLVSTRLILYAPEVFDYWFQARIESKYPVYVRSAGLLLGSGAQVACILLNLPVLAFLAALVLSHLTIAVGLWLVFRSVRDQPFVFQSPRMQTVRSMLSRSWPLVVSGLSTLVYLKIDLIMIGRIVGNAEAGIYAAAAKLSEIWYFLPVAITASVYPEIIRAFEEDTRHAYLNKMQRLYDLLAGLSLMIVVPVWMFASPLVLLLFGADYTESATVLRIHVWSLIFMSIGSAQTKRMLAEKMYRSVMAVSVAGAVVNVGLNLFLIPWYQSTGAAWATFISYFVYGYGILALIPETRVAFLQTTRSFVSPITRLYEWVTR